MQVSDEKIVFMRQKIEELSLKAGLSHVPELCISKTERLANVNPFQYRISVGESMLSLWQEGRFDDSDVEATLAHEIGHLMDFRWDSESKSFRNLLFESLWFASCVVPLIMYLFSPSLLILVLAVSIAVAWALSLPLVVRRVEKGIELEADKYAALYLVKPSQLAKALDKISYFGLPGKTLSFTAKLSFLTDSLTHPSLKERLQNLQTLGA